MYSELWEKGNDLCEDQVIKQVWRIHMRYAQYNEAEMRV